MSAHRSGAGSWVAVVVVSGLLAAGCGGAATSTATATTRPAASTTGRAATTRAATTGSTGTAATAAVSTARPRRHHRHRPAPGTLPQTFVLPSAHTRVFHAQMAALWRGVQTDSVHAALPAFFPEAAYVQLKGIADPQGDWQGRLVADYGLDIGAAHALLGAHPGSARLVGVEVPESYAHWVPPGVCANTVGYYEVPNARVVYRGSAGIESFGIASMISWRGVWYIVHLGAVLRSTAVGVVDDPSAGAGVSAYSSTC